MPSQPNVSKAVTKNRLLPIGLAAGLLTGCTAPRGNRIDPPPPGPTTASSTRPAADDPAIAAVGTTTVRQSGLVRPLMEAYGFNLLMLIVQRDMARQACAEQSMVVTPTDIRSEYNWTLETMFPNLTPADDREKLLDQFLAQPKPRDQMSTRTEFEIIVDTNAHLRKLVQPTITKAVTNEMLQQQFDETYGAQVKVRHIMTDNLQDAAAARRRIEAGEEFAAVARQVSRNPDSRRLGGELPPFGVNTARLPDNFKRVAFALKPGEISDIVQAGGGYHLIKLDQRIAPKAVKFGDVKESLRQDYEAKLILDGVKAVRGRLAQQALAQLTITEPTLKAEFDKRLASRDQLIRDREKMREQMEKDRAKAFPPATSATTAPSALIPASAPATAVSATEPTSQPATAPATEPTAPPPAIGKTPTATEPVAPPAPSTTPATSPAATTGGGTGDGQNGVSSNVPAERANQNPGSDPTVPPPATRPAGPAVTAPTTAPARPDVTTPPTPAPAERVVPPAPATQPARPTTTIGLLPALAPRALDDGRQARPGVAPIVSFSDAGAAIAMSSDRPRASEPVVTRDH